MRGIALAGDDPQLLRESEYTPALANGWDAQVFYGLQGNLPKIFAHAVEFTKAVYVDLGYFGRREGGRFAGYHKITVNARHPSAYYRKPQHPADRWEKFGIALKPYRDPLAGRYVLVAGMSPKAAWAEGFKPMEWERATCEMLQRITHRPIIFRPKPSDPHATHIPGTYLSPPKRELARDFEHAHAIVSHHSNINIEGLIEGIPSFTWGGVARAMSSQNLNEIDSPLYPVGRHPWLADIAYTQWSIPEIEAGLAWAHLRAEGLV